MHDNAITSPRPQFCTDCGTKLLVAGQFCTNCGMPAAAPAGDSPVAPGTTSFVHESEETGTVCTDDLPESACATTGASPAHGGGAESPRAHAVARIRELTEKVSKERRAEGAAAGQRRSKRPRAERLVRLPGLLLRAVTFGSFSGHPVWRTLAILGWPLWIMLCGTVLAACWGTTALDDYSELFAGPQLNDGLVLYLMLGSLSLPIVANLAWYYTIEHGGCHSGRASRCGVPARAWALACGAVQAMTFAHVSDRVALRLLATLAWPLWISLLMPVFCLLLWAVVVTPFGALSALVICVAFHALQGGLLFSARRQAAISLAEWRIAEMETTIHALRACAAALPDSPHPDEDPDRTVDRAVLCTAFKQRLFGLVAGKRIELRETREILANRRVRGLGATLLDVAATVVKAGIDSVFSDRLFPPPGKLLLLPWLLVMALKFVPLPAALWAALALVVTAGGAAVCVAVAVKFVFCFLDCRREARQANRDRVEAARAECPKIEQDLAALEAALADLLALDDRVIEGIPRWMKALRAGEIAPGDGLLLHGPSGGGKQGIACAIAAAMGWRIRSCSLAEFRSHEGGGARGAYGVWHRAGKGDKRTVIIVDDCDEVFPKPGSPSDCPATRKITEEFLTKWDRSRQAANHEHVWVIGATSRPDLIDPDALSRFGTRIEIPLPDRARRKQALEAELLQAGQEVVLPEALLERTGGLSGRGLVALARRAQALAHPQPVATGHLWQALDQCFAGDPAHGGQ